MAFTASRLEELVGWCSASPGLRDAKRQARAEFFGDGDPRPTKYWPGTDDPVGRDRRFLGWFVLGHQLEDGRRPGELAAERLSSALAREEAEKCVRQARYVMAPVATVLPNRGLYLEFQDERLEVRSKVLARNFRRDQTLVSWLVPSRQGLWIPGPGWVEWPVRLGPNMRKNLKELQPDPISVERLLQRRATPEEERRERPPTDDGLEAAVARMTQAAQAEGRTGVVMKPEEWAELVNQHMGNPDVFAFTREFMQRLGDVDDADKLRGWLALANNIWNNAPQRDRGGRSANQLQPEGPGVRYLLESTQL